MTEIKFFPAAIVGHFNKITKNAEADIYKFWTDKSLFRYDCFLYSFYYLQYRYNKLRDNESYFDSINFHGTRMIDSGGFQVRTLGVKISPEDVIRTYARERANIGMILDIPSSIVNKEEYILETISNTEYMVNNKDRIKNTELLNVLHGFTRKERRRYYTLINKFNGVLDGWAVALIKRLHPIYNAWSFLFLYENDKTLKDKRFHFLGLTGNKNVPFMYYLAKLNLVKSISFDSTKYGREGILADMRNPSYMMERLSIGNNIKGKLSSNKFCPCPICTAVSIEDMQKDTNFIILHNLFWEIKKFEFFNSFSTAEDLKAYIYKEKTHIYDETRQTIDFIDYALEHGLEKAERKFSFYFIAKEPKRDIHTLDKWFGGIQK